MNIVRTLISEEELKAKVSEIATCLREEFQDEEIVLVGVLKGSIMFMADIARELGTNVVLDFMQVSSYYGNIKSSGNVQIRKDLDINIRGKNVVLVEDIVDSGLTLQHLRELLSTRKPKSFKVISLLSKPEARLHNIHVDYIGFDIPNEFVVGYGLDYEEKYRNLPYIGVLEPK